MRKLQKLLAPLYRGLKQLLRAGNLIRVDDTKSIQMIQLETLSGEIIEVPRIQDYGITSVPLPGAKGVVAAIGGKTNGYVVIKMDDGKYRPVGLKKGEVALYDDQGQIVHLGREKILIKTPLDLEIRARNIKIHASDSYTFDVNGQGQRWDGQGVETWQDNDVVKPTHDHSPPEVS